MATVCPLRPCGGTSPEGGGKGDGGTDCHVAALLAMTVGADLCVRPPTADAATKNAPVSYVVRDKGVNSSAVPLLLPPEVRRPLKVCPVTGAAGGAY